LNDNSTSRTDEWRSFPNAVPEGEDRTLDLRWFWKYNIAAGSEFRARLRLSNDMPLGTTLTNPVTELFFTISGSKADWEMFETSLAIADAIRSFDLTFISGGLLGATGSLFIDDISAALAPVAPLLAGDYNDDGIVDASDYVVWRKNLGGSFLPNETVTLGSVDEADYDVWRAGFGTTFAGGGAVNRTERVPEPSSLQLVLLMLVGSILARRHRRS
jgi:hypothetical protein